MVDWLKKAPTSIVITVIVMCGVLALSVLAAFLILSVNGVDTTEFRQWINTIGQILVFPFLGVTTTAAVQAARSSSKTEDQTNGNLTALQLEVRRLSMQLARKEQEEGPGE